MTVSKNRLRQWVGRFLFGPTIAPIFPSISLSFFLVDADKTKWIATSSTEDWMIQ
jgi:hypothetical protein